MIDKSTKKAVLLLVTVTSFMTPFTSSSINVALPAIQNDFGVNAILLAWIPTSYLISSAIFLIPFGKIADTWGRPRIFIFGLVISSVASLFSTASFNIEMLLITRVLQGVGTAMISSTGTAMLAAAFPPGERGRVIGINVAMVHIGRSVGPFVGGILTEHVSWRGIFGVTVLLGVLTIVIAIWKMGGDCIRNDNDVEKFDVFGSAFYAFSIMTFMFGLSDLPSLTAAFSIILGICVFVIFIRWELIFPTPVLSLELFITNRAFAFSSLAALINYSATFAVTFLLSLYFQYVRSFTPEHAGMVLMAQPITMAILSPIAGRISDQIEPRKVASFGMCLTALGLFLLSFLNEHTRLTLILLDLTVLGCGSALFSSPNTNAIMTSVDRSSYGLASGVVGSTRLLGQTISMGLASVMFAIYIGPENITPVLYPIFTKSVGTAFILLSIICVLGIYPSMARGAIISRIAS